MAKKSAPRKSTTRSKGKSAKRSSTTRRRTVAAKSRSVGKSARRKVGASRSAAKKFAGKRDFGVQPNDASAIRQASEEAKHRPAGDHREDDRQPRSGVDSREAGVGMRDAGPGSDSGGDVDSDIIGIGGGPGLAQSGPDQPNPSSQR
jgi:hypothetical protein